MKPIRVMVLAAISASMMVPTIPVAARQAVRASAGIAAEPIRRADYTLGAGDKLRITVFGEDEMTGEYSVTGGGTIAFPLIGSIAAVGHTLADVQESIRAKLAAGYIKDPRVAVEVLEYRTFYILGEVNKPGEYPYRASLTLEQAVATAGGYTYRANKKRFAITHAADGAESRVPFRDAHDLRVEPGDTVRILERFF